MLAVSTYASAPGELGTSLVLLVEPRSLMKHIASASAIAGALAMATRRTCCSGAGSRGTDRGVVLRHGRRRKHNVVGCVAADRRGAGHDGEEQRRLVRYRYPQVPSLQRSNRASAQAAERRRRGAAYRELAARRCGWRRGSELLVVQHWRHS